MSVSRSFIDSPSKQCMYSYIISNKRDSGNGKQNQARSSLIGLQAFLLLLPPLVCFTCAGKLSNKTTKFR